MRIRPKSLQKKSAEKPGTGSRLGLFLFGCFFFSIGLIAAAVIGFTVWQIIDSYSWEEQTCTVVEQQIEETRDDEQPYVVRLRYSYEYNGQVYDGKQIGFSTRSFKSLIKAERLAAKYPVGKVITCLVNPNKPTQSILERDSLWIGLFIIIPIVFIGVGALIIYSAWAKPVSSDTVKSPSSRGKKILRPKNISFSIDVLLIVLIILGAVLTYYFGIRTIQTVYEAERWPVVQGTVLTSRIIESESDDSTTYSGYVAYSYAVDGNEYRNDRYSFMSVSSSCYSCARNIVKSHPKGAAVRVYYDPLDPARSVLSREFRWSYLLGFIPAFFSIIALIILFTRRRPRATSGQDLHIQPDAHWQKPLLQQRMDSGTGLFEIEPVHSNLIKVIGIAGFTFFWNGVVALLLFSGDMSFRLDFFSAISMLFFLPFIIIGLFCFGLTLYLFIALWSPTITILLPSTTLAPGHAYTGRWKVKGSYKKISNLRITLQAQEHIFYSSGGDRSEKKEVVFTKELLQLPQAILHDSGELSVEIPSGVMHSLETDHTKLEWSFQVKARVLGLPDIAEQIPVHIGYQ